MKQYIKKIVRNIFFRFFPEVKNIIDRGDIAFNWIANSLRDTQIDRMVKLYSPYSLSKVKIGKGTYIAPNSKISYTTIGNFCSIGPNFLCGWGIHPATGISTSPYFYSTLKQNGSTIATENLIEERKFIKIGNDVFIGANVTVLDGITIGDGAIIGAGTVVSKDIPDYAIAVGCPVRIIKYRFSEELIKQLKKIEWWNFDEQDLKLVNKYFFDIDNFIKKYNK
jgi:acetyltransferase-like isoleucine patch superfamily enzyme